MRPIAYFEFRHAGGDYINLAPVSQMICGGSCSDNENERCVRRNNMFELVEVTITNTGELLLNSGKINLLSSSYLDEMSTV